MRAGLERLIRGTVRLGEGIAFVVGVLIVGGLVVAFGVGFVREVIGANNHHPAHRAVSRSRPACDPNYTGCVPDTGYDVDCDEVEGPVQVVGYDVDGLDADGDGIACEWS